MSSEGKPVARERNPIVAVAAVVVAVCLIYSAVFPEDSGVALRIAACAAMLCIGIPAFAVLDYAACELLRAAMFFKSTVFGRALAIAFCSALAAASILALRLAFDAHAAGVIDLVGLIALVVVWVLGLALSGLILRAEIELEDGGGEADAITSWAARAVRLGAGKKTGEEDSDGRG